MVKIIKPRYVQDKATRDGVGWYWVPPTYWKEQAKRTGRSFPFEAVTLGANFSQLELDSAAKPHNALFDEWRAGGIGDEQRTVFAYGSIRWLLDEYQKHDSFLRRVSKRSRPDYKNLYRDICDLPTKNDKTFGDLPVSSVSPAAAEKIYSMMIVGDRFRRGEKTIMYMGTAWRRMQPHYPREFRTDVPNPWDGVTKLKRKKKIKAAVTREEVYVFARAAETANRPEVAAAAVICFEWLQRPENVIAGYVQWPNYVPGESILIEHHKTGASVRHPLSGIVGAEHVLFYANAESVLGKLPKRGISLILGPQGQQYKPSRFAQIVREVANAAGLPKHFTLDACRHGGMTELEEASLTDGQGRALSAHKSKAYDGYAKRSSKRMLAATARRWAHVEGTDAGQISERAAEPVQNSEKRNR